MKTLEQQGGVVSRGVLAILALLVSAASQVLAQPSADLQLSYSSAPNAVSLGQYFKIFLSTRLQHSPSN